MPSIERTFQVTFRHQVHFTQNVFEPANILLKEVMTRDSERERHKVLVIVDESLAEARPNFIAEIEAYFANYASELDLVCAPLVIEGGERTKNSYFHVSEIHSQID